MPHHRAAQVSAEAVRLDMRRVTSEPTPAAVAQAPDEVLPLRLPELGLSVQRAPDGGLRMSAPPELAFPLA